MTTRLASLSRLLSIGLLSLAFGGVLNAQTRDLVQAESIRIGIIGTGNIGGALARHWVNAGHEVLLISVPYGAMPQISDDLAAILAGKVVLDTGNPIEGRDGDIVEAALAGDDDTAIAVAHRLVDDSGFDGVLVGPLDASRYFDLGQPLAVGDRSAEELRRLMAEVL